MRVLGPSFLAATAATAAVVALAACAPDLPAESAASPPAAGPRLVRVARPEPQAAEVSFPSSLYVERDVLMTARRSGMIEKVLVDRGTAVTAGQPLAQLETDVASSELEMADQDLRFAQAEFARVSSLRDQHIVSPQQFEGAEIARDQARSRKDLAAAQLERCTVRAPFDGVVAERWAVVGQRVEVDDSVPLFRVLGRDPLRARADVLESRLQSLTTGAEAWIEFDGAEPQRARVVFISPAVDPASGTAPVVVEAVPPAGRLRPGAAVRVRFGAAGAAPPRAALIPREACRGAAERGDDITILVIADGRATERRLRVVEAQADSLTVSGGLDPAERVILGAPEGLAPGDPVEARPDGR